MKIPLFSRFSALTLLLLVPAALGAPSLMENLDRGMVAVRTNDSDVFVGWRVLGTDFPETTFNLYRATGGGAPVQLNGDPISGPTHFVDSTADLTQANAYFVRPVVFGLEGDPSPAFTLPANAPVQQYLGVALQRPPGGTTPVGENFSYSPNDTSVADLDGDGAYDLVIKWEPSNAKDPSQNGFTGPTIWDAYKLDGTHLWRIDSGINVRAGPHDTPFIVYDLDGDGRAEVVLKTAPGTRDGLGNFIADPAKFSGDFPTEEDPNNPGVPFLHTHDYRNSSGRALAGPEFMTIFDGLTGAELTSTNFYPERHPDTNYETSEEHRAIWGDNFGNRQARIYPPGIAYLDGQRPSIVWGRGYAGGQSGHPGRIALGAWNWRDGALTELWTFDSRGHPQESQISGQGSHTALSADLDGDGRDEIVYGQLWLNHDGTIRYLGWGHGDALHVSNMDPDRPGQQVMQPHESPSQYGPNAVSFVDGTTGDLIWGIQASGDIGRGVAADIDPRFRGYEMWASGGTGGLHTAQLWLPNETLGPRALEVVSNQPNSINHAVWWDGDLLRELLDQTTISKWNWETESTNSVLSPAGISSNNGTKANPSIQADILGDWREEVIWRESNNEAIRIYTTTEPTEHRMYTLMHDRQYRVAIVAQNVGYNQPPHPIFFLGDGMDPAPIPEIATSLEVLLGPPPPVFTAVTEDTGAFNDDFVTSDTTLVLHGTAEPDTTVDITRLGVGEIASVPADGSGNWSFDYTGTALPEGETRFIATATDGDGNTGAVTAPPLIVIVDTTPPGAPEIGDVADDGDALIISGTAEPGSAVLVSLDGTTDVGTAVADDLGVWSLEYEDPVSPASHSFTAVAADLAGNTGPASAAFVVDTSVATPAITGILDDTGVANDDGVTFDNELTINGTAAAGNTVSVILLGSGAIGSAIADGSGNWSFGYTETLADGSYAFAARASDGGDSSPSSPAFLVTVDTARPVVLSSDRHDPESENTASDTVIFRVTFSEPVAGVDAGDFTLTFTDGLSGSISAIAATSGTTFDVTVELVDEGTVRFDVNDGASITDVAGNALDGGFDTGQVYNRLLSGDGTWIRNESSGLWGDHGNWEDGIIGAGVDKTADFGTLDITGEINVHLDSPRTLGHLIFGDTDPVTAGGWLVDNNGDAGNGITLGVLSGAPTLTVNTLSPGATTTLGVSLAGTSGMNKLGSGPLVLTESNTLTGQVNINGGVLRLADGGTLSNGNNQINVGSNTQLHVQNGTLTNENLVTVVSSPLVIDQGTVELNNFRTNSEFNGTLRLNGGTLTVNDINIGRNSAGSPSFNSGVIIAGGTATANTIRLGTRNSNGAMSVEGGDLTATGAVTIGDQVTGGRGGAMRVVSGTFDSTDTTDGVIITRRNNNVASATFSGGLSNVEKFTVGFDASVASGSGTLRINGGHVYLGAGGLTSNGTGTFAANVILSSGMLGALADWSTALNINLPTNGNITFKAADAAEAPFDIDLTGVLSGNGGFTKSGGGVLTLGGANTFGGAAHVDGGTLNVAGSVAASANPLAVNSGGTLAGVGTVSRSIELNSGGIVSPGDGTAGSVLNGDSLLWNGGGVLAIDLGVGNQLALTGELSKGTAGTFEVAFDPGTEPEEDTAYTLATFGSSNFNSVDFTASGISPVVSGFLIQSNSLKFATVADGPAAQYNLWSVLYEIPAGERGFDDNPSGDGVTNGLKFYLVLDPFATTSEGIVSTTVDVGGTTYPAIMFVRRENLGGVTGGVLVSSDLGFTSDLGSVEVSAESQGDGTEIVVVRSLVSLAAEPDQFFRVTATLPAE